MAWRCGSSTNTGLISNLRSAGIIKYDNVADAFMKVDRGHYAPSKASAYEDSPQYIGYDATISAPHMHAHCVELMRDVLAKATDPVHILDVGSGSGYLVAVFARFDQRATVIGLDYVPELVKMSEKNLRKADADLLDDGRVVLATRNGWEGYRELAPFDFIHVGAAADGYPIPLMEQLKVGGRMIIPVGKENGAQELVQVDRLDDGTSMTSFDITPLMGVRYVPLVNDVYTPSDRR
jgi:protein-L-isoaspartate(D-aspartate) O-methyltransferase